MSAEMMIALVCLGSGLLLALGGFLFGKAGAAEPVETGTDAAELKFKLEQAEASIHDARKQMDGERTSFEMKIAAAKLERDRYSNELEKALKEREFSTVQPAGPSTEELDKARAAQASAEKERDELRALQTKTEKEREELRALQAKTDKERNDAQDKVKELEDKLRRSRPSIPSLEMERDMKQAREEIDRLRSELARQDSRLEGMKSNIEKATGDLEKLTKERDEARERQEAADRIIEAVRARSSGLQQQLKEAQAEIAKLKGG